MGGLRNLVLAALAVLVAASAAAARAPAGQAGMPGFRSEGELRAFLRKATALRRAMLASQPPPLFVPPPAPAPVAAPGVQADVSAPAATTVEENVATSPGITNNQIQGVDEGDIVKLHGEDLIILRRGRLFVVSLAHGRMRLLSDIDAYPPGVDGRGDWYDEMLVSGDRIIVIGYSYARHGTQVNRFRIDAEGRLSFEDAYAFRSGDYYSWRNYASRLVGSQLILYAPLPFYTDEASLDFFPAMRAVKPGGGEVPMRRIVNAAHVYIPRSLLQRPQDIDTLHSVMRCDITRPVLDCDATVVLGATSRTFFVSRNAVYVWTGSMYGLGEPGPAMLYRMPFDHHQPGAVGVRGQPVDQFSFSPDARRGLLHVLVEATGSGDRMWRPGTFNGDLALLDLPMRLFGDGARKAPLAAYAPLPATGGRDLVDRYVGDHLLYGAGDATGAGAGALIDVTLPDHRTHGIGLDHAVERIDLVGRDAIVIGEDLTDHGLGFTTVALEPAGPRIAERLSLPAAAQEEVRSHAFFFHPDSGGDGGAGLIGLPVRRPAAHEPRLLDEDAAMLFLTRRGGRLGRAGELEARNLWARDDRCVASCVDWYGNARPIFVGGRVFALMGYELVEGRETDGRIIETGRADFGPPPLIPPTP